MAISDKLYKKLEEHVNRYPIFTVYQLLLNKEVVYVGRTIDIIERIITHTRTKKFNEVSVLWCKCAADMFILETYLISTLKPKLNRESMSNEYPTFKLRYKRGLLAHKTFNIT